MHVQVWRLDKLVDIHMAKNTPKLSKASSVFRVYIGEKQWIRYFNVILHRLIYMSASQYALWQTRDKFKVK